jgi:sterol desaturase/sphingolipid hydroxylase (fatty acid hydroxylase superfamily)
VDDTQFGTRDIRGNWRPSKRLTYPDVFVWPIRPLRLLRWIPEYVLSWNLFYAVVAVGVWFFLTPSIETMKSLSPGWIIFVFARNGVLTFIFFGSFHFRLYMQKAQDKRFKYNARWLDTDNPVFLFGNQTIDNLIWTFGAGVQLWTLYEVATLWAFANGIIPWVDWARHPIYCTAVMLAVPLMRELHFYLVHRLLHWSPLYQAVHKLHHCNFNPGPWSGLAMHPVEHLGYFSGVLIHWILPSHPVHAIFHLVHAGLSPAPAHTGFEKVELGRELAVDTQCFAHYLHHKYFNCNYADGVVPLDRWFGTFRDGADVKKLHQ